MCVNLKDIVFMHHLIRLLHNGSTFNETIILLEFDYTILLYPNYLLTDSHLEATSELFIQ